MLRITLPLALMMLASLPVSANQIQADNRYSQHNFVANKEEYKPTLATQKNFINGWGIAIRPKGAGGHFWVTAHNISHEYVGDVSSSNNKLLQNIHQDNLQTVTLPVGGEDKFATGVVFSGSKENFIITQKMAGVEDITAPAKFLFASDGGIISAWTERKKADGSFDWPAEAVTVIDQAAEGAQFFGVAVSAAYNRIYAADFGIKPAIKVFDGQFQPLAINFDLPFDDNKNKQVDAGEYAPFNVQALTTPTGKNHIFVTYAKTQPCPETEIEKGTCKKGEIFAGEEDTEQSGHGRLAEFTEDGKLVSIWKDGGKLSAPWGIAYAPANFGALSQALLVANFGDGTIAAFNPTTHEFMDIIRDSQGKPIKIEKIWGILFGNGESLGDTNALYFAAGPSDEKDGIFGALRPILP
ncbi:MAG: TIGR03118 family protein [Alphaproteobacteria bacterium]